MKLLLPLAGLLVISCGMPRNNTQPVNAPAAVAVSRAAVSTGGIAYRGVNLAGAEFGIDPYGAGTIPGTFGTNYTWPDPTYVAGYASQDYFVGKGMTAFRVPFRWERLQPVRNQSFNPAELARLTTTVGHITGKNAAVILDPHNYARWGTTSIGSANVPNADFADFWSRLAQTFKGNAGVVFGLMNEPHDMPTEQWFGAAQAAVNAIRATGAMNLILVPGNGWDGAGSWSDNWYGTPNAAVMARIVDPGNNFAFEVHQYLDDNAGGNSQTCVSATIGSQRLSSFTTWLKANNKRAFLGEFGGGPNVTCSAALDDMIKHMEANASVWIGWTYWAAGPWWGASNTFPSIEPRGGADAFQMAALSPHLTPAPPAPPPSTCTLLINGQATDASTVTIGVKQ